MLNVRIYGEMNADGLLIVTGSDGARLLYQQPQAIKPLADESRKPLESRECPLIVGRAPITVGGMDASAHMPIGLYSI
jgi:hypothetical protein